MGQNPCFRRPLHHSGPQPRRGEEQARSAFRGARGALQSQPVGRNCSGRSRCKHRRNKQIEIVSRRHLLILSSTKAKFAPTQIRKTVNRRRVTSAVTARHISASRVRPMAMPDSSPLSAGLASAEQCEGLSEYELQRMLRISRELCAHSFALALAWRVFYSRVPLLHRKPPNARVPRPGQAGNPTKATKFEYLEHKKLVYFIYGI